MPCSQQRLGDDRQSRPSLGPNKETGLTLWLSPLGYVENQRPKNPCQGPQRGWAHVRSSCACYCSTRLYRTQLAMKVLGDLDHDLYGLQWLKSTCWEG